MSNVYVLDACALIAVLTNEPGADVVKNLLQKAVNSEIKVSMHKVNFLEVYYHTYKLYGEPSALNLLEYINMSPIEMDAEITDDVLIDAGRLKSLYKISLADSVGLAKAKASGGYFVTADHHEMDILEERENASIIWIRDKK